MLRKRSIGIGNYPAGLVPDSPTAVHKNFGFSSSIFTSPRPFFPASDHAVKSPTSTLEAGKHLPFFSDRSPRKPSSSSSSFRSNSWGHGDASPAAGLGLLHCLDCDPPNGTEVSDQPKPPESRRVLFGSQLKVQIPRVNSNITADSPRSPPIEFGIKNKESQLALYSLAHRSALASSANGASSSPRIVASPGMELSEDYTCVISRGPNPRTVHIFDNFVIESHGEVLPTPTPGYCSRQDNRQGCNKNLGQDEDIFNRAGDMDDEKPALQRSATI